MPTVKYFSGYQRRLPKSFAQLVHLMPPQAIVDDVSYENTLEIIDQLMLVPQHTPGQSLYLETLVQLVQAYESREFPMDTPATGLDALKHLLAENAMDGTDLAEILKVSRATGSKILRGTQPLTVEHVRKLAAKFRVAPSLFIGLETRV